MEEEPFGLRVARFFLFLGALLLILFLLSDYSGYPRFSWLFWAMVLLLVGYVMRQRYVLQYREGVSVSTPPPEESSRRSAKGESKKKSGKDPRFRLRRKRRN